MGFVGDAYASVFGVNITDIEERLTEDDPNTRMFPSAVWVAAPIEVTPQQSARVQETIVRGMKERGYTVISIRSGENVLDAWIAMKLDRSRESINADVARRDLEHLASRWDLASYVSQATTEVNDQIIKKTAQDVKDKIPDAPTIGIGIGIVVALVALVYFGPALLAASRGAR